VIIIFLEILFLTALFLTLSFSSNILLHSLDSISRKLKINEFALSNLLVALGTSIPELIICINSALKKKPDLAIGNILGSNIANLSLVIGGAALLAGSLKIDKDTLKTNIYYTFLVATAPLLVLSDGKLSRTDGLLLLLLYLFWQKIIFSQNQKISNISLLERIRARTKNDSGYQTSILFFLVSLAGMLLSAEGLVEISIRLASRLNTPPFLIGVFFLGVGSSLPELMFEINAIKEKRSRVALGNILGSVITNSSLILGITVLIAPLNNLYLRGYSGATLYLLLVFLLFLIFIRSKAVLERWEGAFLTFSYIILLIIELG
jgi:cation:H+ antiporter